MTGSEESIQTKRAMLSLSICCNYAVCRERYHGRPYTNVFEEIPLHTITYKQLMELPHPPRTVSVQHTYLTVSKTHGSTKLYEIKLPYEISGADIEMVTNRASDAGLLAPVHLKGRTIWINKFVKYGCRRTELQEITLRVTKQDWDDRVRETWDA